MRILFSDWISGISKIVAILDHIVDTGEISTITSSYIAIVIVVFIIFGNIAFFLKQKKERKYSK